MFEPVVPIARNAFAEAIRQPVYPVVVGFGLLSLLGATFLECFSFDDGNRLFVDMGLSVILTTGLILAALVANSVLHREVERRTALLALTKPVSRTAFVIGKFLGVMAAMGIACWIWFAAFALAVQGTAVRADWTSALGLGLGAIVLASIGAGLLNYLYRFNFSSALTGWLCGTLPVAALLFSAIHGFHESVAFDQIGYAALLTAEAVFIVTAMAVACSARWGQVVTLVTCIIVFALSLSGEGLFGRMAARDLWLEGSAGLHPQWPGIALARLADWVLPNLQLHSLSDALALGHDVNGAYILTVSAYSAIYVLVMLALSVALFHNREVG